MKNNFLKNNNGITVREENGTTCITSEKALYASEFLETIPIGNIDKTICGCGFTTVVLENKQNVVIAMPTRYLIDNKASQYPNTRVDWNVIKCYGEMDLEHILFEISELKQRNKPIKILATYDSLYKIEILLTSDLYDFKLIVDEADQLLHYAKLKATSKTLLDVSNVTEYIWSISKKVKYKTSFISATPIPLMYLPAWIAELKQYKFKWSNVQKKIPIKYKAKFPQHEVNQNVIGAILKNGYFSFKDAKVRKLIIFINSVTSIVKMIKANNLPVEDVAILCGTSKINSLKIKEYKILEDPNDLPQFTFVTAAGFQGIDLNDKEALSVIISTVGRDYTMLNINFDVKQAISRNRNRSNPFYGTCLYVYNKSIFNTTESELLKIIDNNYCVLDDNVNTIIKESGRPKLSLIKTLNSSKFFFTYTNQIDEETVVINENLFNADRFFVIETRRLFDDGFRSVKGNTVDVRPESFGLIEKIHAPLFKDYVSHFQKIKDPDCLDFAWNPYMNNEKYKNRIEKVYGRFSLTFDSYKQTNLWYNKPEIPEYIDATVIERVDKVKFDNNYVRLTTVKKIVKDVFETNGIKMKVTNNYILSLYDGSVIKVKYFKSDGGKRQRYLKIG